MLSSVTLSEGSAADDLRDVDLRVPVVLRKFGERTQPEKTRT